MGKPQDNHNHKKIPIPLIVFGYMLSPPAGVVLTILRVLTDAKGSGQKKTSSQTTIQTQTWQTNTAGQTYSAPQSTSSEKTKSTAKSSTKRGGISVPALVLGILAAFFLLCAGISLVEGLATLSLSTFFGDYFSGVAVLSLLALCCGLPAVYFKKQHDIRNVIRSIIGRRETILLTQLASAADLKPKKLRKELQAMINKGEFGEEAYIDLSSGRFMRHPDEMEEMLRKEAEKSFGTESSIRTEEPVEDVEESARFRFIILQIRKLNDDIKDYAVSERIYRIEEHTQNIFDYVTAHPEAMPQIRTFMNYYLPTTLKLLDSYSRIEQMGVAGKNMQKSKENIEEILDTLVDGFQQQVDKLFANESMDISSEITVLEAMMKQDGLDGRSDFDPETAPAFTDGYTDDLSDTGAAQAKL